MTKLSILALTALSATAFAGQEITASRTTASSNTLVIPREACFGETELQLDLFWSSVNSDGPNGDGTGGGLGLTYFYHRYFGFGLDAHATDSEADTVWQGSAMFVARYPFDFGNLCLAPYFKTAVGVQSEDGTNAFLAIGGGIEWRASSRVGVFAESTFGFMEDREDFVNVRAGLRFVF